jgi:hypothetical protein
MKNHLVSIATASALSCTAASAQVLDCKADPDSCIRSLVAETAVFIEECGKAFPTSKVALESLFNNWGLLRLSIPQLAEATNSASPLRVKLSAQIAPYLERIPSYEKEIECTGRVEMIRKVPFELRGDSAKLHPGELEKYTK